MPEITVLMSVHNGESFLKEAIGSILRQTFTDFELLIVNDASTDKSVEIIRHFSDNRIKLEHNEKNLGLTRSLNKGLELAKGRFIARMDADDISLPGRLAKQLEFMRNNEDVGICGTQIETFGDIVGFIPAFPTEHNQIKCHLFYENVLPHSSVMMNTALLKKYNLKYDDSFLKTQDYELWARAAKYFKLANLEEVLLKLRFHNNQIRNSKGKTQADFAADVRRLQIKKLIDDFTDEELELNELIAAKQYSSNMDFLKSTEKWLNRLIIANNKKEIFPEKEFKAMLAQKWFDICKLCSVKGMKVWVIFEKSPLKKYLNMNLKQKRDFFVRCLKRRD